jgi:hypothetical protein
MNLELTATSFEGLTAARTLNIILSVVIDDRNDSAIINFLSVYNEMVFVVLGGHPYIRGSVILSQQDFHLLVLHVS